MTTISPKTLDWVIEHFAVYRDTDIFPRTFEYDALYFGKDELIKTLSKQDILQWRTRPYRRCLVPKQRYGFRIGTQLDPLDMILYTSLLIETGEIIEKSRVSPSKKIAFSYRFDLDDTNFTVFDKGIGYEEFQRHSDVLANKYGCVVVTDIADFYPRIYFHRLENALNSALGKLPHHAKAICQLIKGWNQNVSYGIPIGNNTSRLLAELVIDDVDRNLMTENIEFTRYVDDYRIFCNSREEAYQRLAHLANILYDTHGLTLQSEKTKIMSADEFIEDYLETEEKRAIKALDSRFEEIINELGLDRPYEEIDYDSLSPDIQKQVDELNLENLLDNQLNSDQIDISMVKFLINRLSQLKNVNILRRLLHNTDKLYPVFPEIVLYLIRVADDIPVNSRHRVGKFLLNKLSDSVVGHLEFHRMLIMYLFSDSNKWGNQEQLPQLYKNSSDSWFRSTLFQAIGKSSQHYWLRSKKPEIDNMPPWDKRAYIYAVSCFPTDEMENYYRALNPKLDTLEKHIITWAKKAPINS